MAMTDKELVEKLIANDPRTIYDFFFVRCRTMLSYVGAYFGNNHVMPEELIGEFYEFLSADGWHKLRIFRFTCSLNSYVTIIASRFFQRKRERELLLLDDDSVKLKNSPRVLQTEGFIYDDIANVMERMSAFDQLLIKRILLDGDKPSEVFSEAKKYIPQEQLEKYSQKQLAGYIYMRYNRAKKTLQDELVAIGYYKK